MKYIYDINLCFYDYYKNYYEVDSMEHFNRLPIYKIDDIKSILLNNSIIYTDYKNIIISDSITSIALEIINNKIAYISSIPYKDEFKINELSKSSDYLKYKVLNKKENNYINKVNSVKNKLINKINENDKEFIKYLYYEITGDNLKSINSMKEFLIKDISNNFNDKYYNLYDIIFIGE